jgi:3D (Asp-Asp-Asp) domain-containing protein
MATLLGLAALFAVAAGDCELYRTTGYTASDYPGLTADGSTTTVAALARGERIAAGSYNLPLGSYVDVEDLGVWRIADRGRLGPRHLDLLVATRAEAYALTGFRVACPLDDGGL